MHTHGHGYHVIVISGATKHWHTGQTREDAPLIGAGNYFYQPGGQEHNDIFPTDEETILYTVWEGPRTTFFDGFQVYPPQGEKPNK